MLISYLWAYLVCTCQCPSAYFILIHQNLEKGQIEILSRVCHLGLAYFLRSVLRAWRKFTSLTFLPKERAMVGMFQTPFLNKTYKGFPSLVTVKSSQLSRLAGFVYLSMLGIWPYNCDIAPTHMFQPFWAIYLVLRFWRGQIITSGGGTSN